MFVLTAQDINRLLDKVGLNSVMDTLIEKTEDALRDFSDETIAISQRSGFNDKGLVEWMPVSIKGKFVVIKVVSYFPENPASYKLATIQAVSSRYDYDNGQVTDMVEGGLLTAIRTGAASAVASRVLARPDSSILGLVGCGAQSVTQAHAISRCFPIREILTFDVCPDAHRSIVQRLAFLGIKVRSCTLEELEANSDIICTATSTNVGDPPVLNGDNLKPHVHINAVGSDYHGKTELPLSFVKQALVVPDHREQAAFEGECQRLDADEIGPELHNVLRHAQDFYSWRDRWTVFDSTGIPLEDAIALDTVCALAKKMKIGTHLNFNHAYDDPKNPYEFSKSTLHTHALLDAVA